MPRLWKFDRSKRWRSKWWLDFARSQSCSAGAPGHVVAAHLRWCGCGGSMRPDDVLVYPLADPEHVKYHNKGQPPVSVQWGWVCDLVLLGMQQGCITGDLGAVDSAMEAVGCDPGGVDIERFAMCWRDLFDREMLELTEPACLWAM